MMSLNCIDCKTSLCIIENSEIINCTNCSKEYINFLGKFPILVSSYKTYLSISLLELEQKKRELINKINTLTAKKNNYQNNRKQNIENYYNSVIRNIETLQNKIAPVLNPLDVISEIGNDSNGGYSDFEDYLLRDWCGGIESEMELVKTITSIKEIINDVFSNKKDLNILIPGCGLNRYAHELTDISQNVYSFDNSLSMIYEYMSLREIDKTFYNYNSKNIKADSAEIILNTTRYKQLINPQSSSKICTFVGNISEIPLEDNSIDVVVSVYFTDVVPIKNYIAEIQRVLKKGGLFIHFGPLDYHFDKMEDRYSLQSLINLFKKNKFDLLSPVSFHPSEHLSDDSLYRNGYNCVLFSCVNKKISIQNETILRNKYPLTCTTLEKIIENSGLTISKSIMFDDGEEYENAESVIEIYKLITPGLSIAELIEKIKIKFEVDEVEFEEIVNVIKIFSDKNIIKL